MSPSSSISGGTDGKPKATLPVQQLAILAIARFCEPVALMSIFPYLPEMIVTFGVPRPEIAKWAGIITATFAVAQSITAVWWGQASDRLGRKPAILAGLVCSMACFLVWGFTRDLKTAIIVRAIQGAGNGNVGIIRTMVAEMVSDKALQPRAFSIMPLVWSLGSIFGPAFGGFFAKPAERFPGLFGDSTLLKAYPFALPNLIAAAFFCVSIATAILFLHETLDTKKDIPDHGIRLGQKLAAYFSLSHLAPPPPRSDEESRDATKIKPKRKAGIKECFAPQSTIALIAYMLLALHSMAYDQIIPVFLNLPIRDPSIPSSHPLKFTGGFGWQSDRIGTVFTLYGLTCSLIQFLIFPPLCAYVGVRNCFRGCVFIMPLAYLVTPFTILLPTVTLRTTALLIVMAFKAFGIILAFPCVIILLTNSAKSVHILGTLNGVATTVSAVGRAGGPALTGWIFTKGLETGWGIAPWWFLAFAGTIAIIPSWMLEDGEGPSQCDDEEETSSGDSLTEAEDYTEETPLLEAGNTARYNTSSAPTLTSS